MRVLRVTEALRPGGIRHACSGARDRAGRTGTGARADLAVPILLCLPTNLVHRLVVAVLE